MLEATDRDKDRYGRYLRKVDRNSQSLGDILVREGLARPWPGRRRSWCGTASMELMIFAQIADQKTNRIKELILWRDTGNQVYLVKLWLGKRT